MRRRTGTLSSFSIGPALFLALLIGGLFWFVFGDKGLLDAWRMREELRTVSGDNDRLGGENESLRREIEALRHDRTYLERIARKELGMARKGEIVFIFKHPPGTAGQPLTAP